MVLAFNSPIILNAPRKKDIVIKASQLLCFVTIGIIGEVKLPVCDFCTTGMSVSCISRFAADFRRSTRALCAPGRRDRRAQSALNSSYCSFPTRVFGLGLGFRFFCTFFEERLQFVVNLSILKTFN